jgi:hypothetical protein
MGNQGSYKLTGFIVLVVGILFFLRDLGINYIGDTSGWTIVLVLIGAGIISGGGAVAVSQAMKKKR